MKAKSKQSLISTDLGTPTLDDDPSSHCPGPTNVYKLIVISHVKQLTLVLLYQVQNKERLQ